jgi:hypothetical protein
MRQFLPALALPLLLAACSSNAGNSSDVLEDAAQQSDPAAAAVLENAAENGMDPQEALQQAGNVQANTTPEVSVQAKPNQAGDRNPKQVGTPPEKVVTKAPAGATNTADEHAGHNAQ